MSSSEQAPILLPRINYSEEDRYRLAVSSKTYCSPTLTASDLERPLSQGTGPTTYNRQDIVNGVARFLNMNNLALTNAKIAMPGSEALVNLTATRLTQYLIDVFYGTRDLTVSFPDLKTDAQIILFLENVPQIIVDNFLLDTEWPIVVQKSEAYAPNDIKYLKQSNGIKPIYEDAVLLKINITLVQDTCADVVRDLSEQAVEDIVAGVRTRPERATRARRTTGTTTGTRATGTRSTTTRRTQTRPTTQTRATTQPVAQQPAPVPRPTARARRVTRPTAQVEAPVQQSPPRSRNGSPESTRSSRTASPARSRTGSPASTRASPRSAPRVQPIGSPSPSPTRSRSASPIEYTMSPRSAPRQEEVIEIMPRLSPIVNGDGLPSPPRTAPRTSPRGGVQGSAPVSTRRSVASPVRSRNGSPNGSPNGSVASPRRVLGGSPTGSPTGSPNGSPNGSRVLPIGSPNGSPRRSPISSPRGSPSVGTVPVQETAPVQARRPVGRRARAMRNL